MSYELIEWPVDDIITYIILLSGAQLTDFTSPPQYDCTSWPEVSQNQMAGTGPQRNSWYSGSFVCYDG